MKISDETSIFISIAVTMIAGILIGIKIGEYKTNSYYQYEIKGLVRCVTPLHKYHADVVTDVNWVTSFSVDGIEDCQEYVGRGLLYLIK